MQLKQVVFPVAGLDTRFLRTTKPIPKEMLPIVDGLMFQYAIDEAKGKAEALAAVRFSKCGIMCPDTIDGTTTGIDHIVERPPVEETPSAIANQIGNPGLFGCRFGGKRFDCSNKLGFLTANIYFGLR